MVKNMDIETDATERFNSREILKNIIYFLWDQFWSVTFASYILMMHIRLGTNLGYLDPLTGLQQTLLLWQPMSMSNAYISISTSISFSFKLRFSTTSAHDN